MSPPVKLGLRFLLACAFLMALAQQFSDTLVDGILPLYRWEIGIIEDRYRVIGMALDHEGADRVVRLQVTLAKPVFIGTQFLMPDERGRADASTLVGHVLQPAVLLFALLLAWPAKNRLAYALRLFAALPFCTIIIMLDVPLVLLASLWGIIVDHLAPNAFSPLILWSQFLQGGGRWALGLAGGAAAIWLENLQQTVPQRHP